MAAGVGSWVALTCRTPQTRPPGHCVQPWVQPCVLRQGRASDHRPVSPLGRCRYRTREEMSLWKARDPVVRFRNWLTLEGWWNEQQESQLRRDLRQQVSGRPCCPPLLLLMAPPPTKRSCPSSPSP